MAAEDKGPAEGPGNDSALADAFRVGGEDTKRRRGETIPDGAMEQAARPHMHIGTMVDMEPSTIHRRETEEPLLQWFRFSQLPPHLRTRSEPFGLLAHHIVETTPANAQRTMALTHLLIAKDAGVRAHILI